MGNYLKTGGKVMNKSMIRIKILALIVILLFTVVGCGNTEEDANVDEAEESNVYEVEEVKQKLVEILDIDESEIITEDYAGRGHIITYNDSVIWLNACFLEDPNNSPEFFDIQTISGDFDEKLIDEEYYKIWIEELDDPDIYSMIAMKDNFVISITSKIDNQTMIEKLDLE